MKGEKKPPSVDGPGVNSQGCFNLEAESSEGMAGQKLVIYTVIFISSVKVVCYCRNCAVPGFVFLVRLLRKTGDLPAPCRQYIQALFSERLERVRESPHAIMLENRQGHVNMPL
ncbi:MAG: hypothetical protein D5S03_07325 [Desulfonatronospira sp. MSAO_Bac3]|nr:MAG: hypothetical protein D5S03_07325 [Desulfonatronospira sp. MSAO_Bac3]